MPDHPALPAMQWASQIFWTLDMVLSFFTGYYVGTVLEMRPSKVCANYIKSWFVIDAAITLPLWLPLMLDDGVVSAKAGQGLKTAKYIKMLRLLRLARLVKFMHVLGETLDLINSPSVLLLLGIMKLMFFLFLLNHLLACLWFLIGTRSSSAWVALQGVEHRDLFYQYLSSIHWSLTQFQGTSDIVPGQTLLERVFAVATIQMALIVFSGFVSTMTNQMMQLQSLHSRRTLEQRVVRGYLSNHSISTTLSCRIKKYIEWKQRLDKRQEHDTEIVKLLPGQLMRDLDEEVRAPLLGCYVFFRLLRPCYPGIVRRICHEALAPLTPTPGERIFTPHDPCSKMYFIDKGRLVYRQDLRHLLSKERHREHMVLSSQYLSEGVLWTNWEHCGELIGIEDAALLTLEAPKFAEIMRSHPAAHGSAVYFARRFIAALNRFGKRYHDLIDSDFFFEEMARDDLDD